MNVAGLILTNIHDEFLPELTRLRAIASVPYGGRYRLIDFALSNMVNANITKVGVITHSNYQSLLDHIGTGKDWDLARRSGGINILPPFVSPFNGGANKIYSTRLEALMGVVNFIMSCKEDYIVLSDCDIVWNLHLEDVIDAHIAQGADITVVTRKIDNRRSFNLATDVREVVADEEGVVRDFREIVEETENDIEISTNCMVINRQILLNIIMDAMSNGNSSFYNYLARHAYQLKIRAYRFQGYYSIINSLSSYFKCNMDMLNSDTRREIFRTPGYPVYTKVRNSTPTIYRNDANVTNSVVADGCIIEGKVENSIIFRGVKIGRGTVVRNSILLQDTNVGDNVSLNCVITDKNVVIRDERTLSGHESLPFFINKGKMI